MSSVNVGVLVVTALALGVAGCKSDSPLLPLERAASINAVGAVTFSGVVGTTVASAPVVRVTDKDGDPVSDVVVVFTVTAGNGSLNASAVTTDVDGRASTQWTLGTTVQTNTLSARVGTLLSLVFTATPVAGPPVSLVLTSGNNQIVAVGASGSPLKVQVTDSFNNPVSGVAVSFSVVSGGGTIAPEVALSDAAGFASVTWTVGPLEGVQSARAQFAGVTVLFSADTFNCGAATPSAPCTGLGELIFIRNLDNQIYRMNVDGKGLTKLTSEGIQTHASWSPDGMRIAFIRYDSGPKTSDVFVMNADGTNVIRKTTGGQYYFVSWAPDGRSLAAEVLSGNDSLNLVTMSADAAGPVTVFITNAGSPAWSPDGKKIAYHHGTSYYDNAQIYVRNADGSDPRRATSDSVGWNVGPAWSPDGKNIAFTRCSLTCGLYVVNTGSSAVTLVTGSPGSQDGAWSPDGRWLALTVYGSGGGSLSYVPSTGGNLRAILAGARRPSWRPATH
jgi:hypothetical protein